MKKVYGNVLVTCRQHWISYWFPLGLAVIFAIGAASYTLSGRQSDGLILLVGTAFFAIVPLYRLLANRFVLTDKMVYLKVGFIRSKILSSSVDKIQNISLTSGLFDKLFGLSTVRIDTVSGVYVIRGVRHAERIMEAYYGLS